MSVRQQIIDKLDTNFNLISIAENYSFDIDGHVYEWRDLPLKDEELPAIIYRDVFDNISDVDEQEHELTVEVALFAVGTASPAAVRSMIADILTNFKLIIHEDFVTGARHINNEMEVEHLKKRYAAAVLTFTVTFYTEIWGT